MFSRRQKKYRQLEDLELVIEFQKSGVSDIIGELYRRYGHLVMGTAMKYLKNEVEAEDLVMHLFEQLPKKLKSHSISHFKSWLYMVTKNECLMVLRKKGRLTNSISTELVAEDQLDVKIQEESQYLALEEALSKLKSEQKDCIRLFYLENFSHQDIAVQLKMDMKKVKSAIQNGKRNLKLYLENRNEFKMDQ
jgi:RNA polymerase sigma-70 factor (ECF subfamily)